MVLPFSLLMRNDLLDYVVLQNILIFLKSHLASKTGPAANLTKYSLIRVTQISSQLHSVLIRDVVFPTSCKKRMIGLYF